MKKIFITILLLFVVVVLASCQPKEVTMNINIPTSKIIDNEDSSEIVGAYVPQLWKKTSSSTGAILTPRNKASTTVEVMDFQFGSATGTNLYATGSLDVASATIGAYTLPIVDGTANYVLTTDGAGLISWSSKAAAGSGTTTRDEDFYYFQDDSSNSTSPTTSSSTLDIMGGSNISSTLSGSVFTIAYTGAAAGTTTADNLWYTITGDTGTADATTSSSTLDIIGGTGITTSFANSALTITNTGSGAGTTTEYEGPINIGTTATTSLYGDNATSTFNSQVVVGDNFKVSSSTASGDDYATLYVDTSSGKVGIGTTAPRTNLHIVRSGPSIGGAIMNLGYTFNDGAGADLDLSMMGFEIETETEGVSHAASYIGGYWEDATEGTEDGGFNIYTIQNSGGPSEKVRVTPAGNVGISTTTPGAELSVSGEIDLGFLTATSTTASSTFSGNLIVDGNVNIGNGDLYVDANSGFIGIATTTPRVKLDIDVGTGDVYFRGDGNVGTGFMLQNNDVSERNWYLAALGDSGGGLGPSKGFAIADMTSGVHKGRLVIDTAGNIGISTTTPETKLEVANGTTTLDKLYVFDDLDVATGTLVVDAESGRVGIGTVGPDYHLDIQMTGGAADTGLYLSGGELAQTNPAIGTRGSFPITFYANGAEKMRLHPSGGFAIGDSYDSTDPGADNVIIEGNVGIGTTTPSEKLDIQGNLRVDGNASTSGTLTVGHYTFPNADGSNTYVLKTDGAGTLSWAADSTGTGLGTTTDGYLASLEVASSTIGVAGAITTILGALEVFEDLRVASTSDDDYAELYVDVSNGRLGLGTTAPVRPLDIRQPADSYGILLYGYDDKSSESGSLNINSAGSFAIAASANIVFSPVGYVYFSSGSSVYTNLGDNAGGDSWLLRDSDSATLVDIDSDGEVYFVGNVGIATTTPSEKLDVQGNLRVDGNASTSGTIHVGGDRVIGEESFSFGNSSSTDEDDDWGAYFVKQDISISTSTCICRGGTSLQISMTDGTNQMSTTTIICDTTDGSSIPDLTNNTFSAGEWVTYDSSSVTGEVDMMICITYFTFD